MNNFYPDISLIITNYNRSKFIGRAIRSCINQVLSGFSVQVIVVDDCSTDDSIRIIENFLPKISLVKNKKNLGVAAASNAGIKRSLGRYIMRVDADDFLGLHACQQMVSILEYNQNYHFVYCDHIRVDSHGLKEKLVKLDTDEMLYLHGAGVMFRKEVLISEQGYDENLRNAEDYDLLVRLHQKNYKGFYLPIPFYRYHIHGGNLTLDESRSKQVEFIKDKYKIYLNP